MQVTPKPALAGLCGCHYRVPGLEEMLVGMLADAVVAAMGAAADLAGTQMHPVTICFKTLFAYAAIANRNFGNRI